MDCTGYRLGGDRYAQTKIKQRRLICQVIKRRASLGKARMVGARVMEKVERAEERRGRGL